MKKFLITALVVALCGCAPMPYRTPLDDLSDASLNEVIAYSNGIKEFLYAGGNEGDAIELGKKAVLHALKDPDSARFRDVRLKAYFDGAVVCGQVNAKNSYGGYAGFKSFVAGIKGATLRDESSKYASVNAASNTGIGAACPGG